MTVPELVEQAAERWPDAPAVDDSGRVATFGELLDAAGRAAAALGDLDVAPGQRVALWAPNSLEWIVAALGVASAGAVLVPVNTRFRSPEVLEVLARSQASVLLTVGNLLDVDQGPVLGELRARAPDLAHVVALDGPSPQATEWAALLEEVDQRRVRHRVSPDDVSHVQFTSGATGRPKGALLRHGALCRTTRIWCEVVGLRPGDRYLLVSPLFHVSGHKTGMLAAMTAGACVHPQAVFDPVEVMARVERDGITVLPGPPTIYQALLEHPRRPEYDLSTLRLAVTGAASIPPTLVGRMRRELGFEVVVTAYGTTEATGVVTMCRPEDDETTVATTSGRAVPGVEVRIHPDTGEVLVRGDTLMAGYLDDPEATSTAIDESGWLHTGDIGELDERGNLRITDRMDDVFQVGGFKTSPAEVEAVLVTHPAIARAAVVGVPDERLGEVGHAAVVLRPGHSLDLEALTAWCRERMANTKVPRHLTLMDVLPENAAGKVHKPTLRQMLGPAPGVPPAGGPVAELAPTERHTSPGGEQCDEPA